ncbi:MAG: DUF2851 family protein [Bacteroidales bacterium]
MINPSLISEKFIHFVWQYQLFHKAVYLVSGELLEVLNPGMLNLDSGPDFLSAKIRIGRTLWVGNVEIHINASDWKKHKHDNDKAYDSVVLHVVLNSDCSIYRLNGIEIPCLNLAHTIPDSVFTTYQKMLLSEKPYCANMISSVPVFNITKWLERMGVERLTTKSCICDKELVYRQNSWEECFFTFLCRAFGGKVNQDPFECLSRIVPIKALAKQKNNLEDIEAILFGQAGFFCEEQRIKIHDKYYNHLVANYKHLKNKYGLEEMDFKYWKFMRMRPGNFPSIRLAQLAFLIHSSSHLFRQTIEAEKVDDLFRLMACTASSYWDTHFRFGVESKNRKKRLGRGSQLSIVINGIIPLMFLYGKRKAKPEVVDKALSFLDSLPVEKNAIVQKFQKIKMPLFSAMHSQAVLHLYKNYCLQKRCLDCGIGYYLLRME